MRSSNKPRSRGKPGHRRNNLGSIVNRVFDSSGPEGKVRGTPQQIIDKYHALARDAQLAGDRVGAENHLQHSEHYARLLGEAQREMAERREAMEAARQAQMSDRAPATPPVSGPARDPLREQQDEQPDVSMVPAEDLFPVRSGSSTLVSTPENGNSRNRRSRNQSNRKGTGDSGSEPAAAKSDPASVMVVATRDSEDSSLGTNA
ncbi:MAG: DUF4167 domain-containing protein [Paracoccaceae bacterium]|nr:DUF4167 domain-containing protein [Paracoccaceae bacterium]